MTLCSDQDTLAAPSGAPALAATGPRLAVVVATVGRAVTAGRTIDRLALQTRRPDRVLAVGVTPADVAGLDALSLPVETYLAPRGLCSQRNFALSVLGLDVDHVVFFDDDFVAATTYLEQVERLFAENPDVVGLTGDVIADGVHGPGIGFEEAVRLLAADGRSSETAAAVWPRPALYGCNMSMRLSAVETQRFDEALPLYGWQEDIDFSYRLGARGRLIKSAALVGVHMGEKVGRQSGLRLGYSQIANPVYLLRKGGMPSRLGRRIMVRNVVSNLWRSGRPEPWVDRRGRLRGNLLAVADLLRGRLDPRRILVL